MEIPTPFQQASQKQSMVTSPWTLTSYPFLDFALASLVLGMATYLLVSRMSQLCNSLFSCWSPPEDPQELQRHQGQIQSPQLVTCIACDRGERTLHAVCTPCVLQVLGQEEATPLLNSEGIKRSVQVFLEKLQKETNNRSVLVLVESLRQQQKQQEQLQQQQQQQIPCGWSGDRDHHLRHRQQHNNTDNETRCVCGCCNVIENLYYELEEERSASEVAANESMAMIARLQHEKSHLLMEGRQYKRIMEEQAFHDQQAISILKEMLLRREAEKTELEEENDLLKRSANAQNGHYKGSERRRSSSEAETSATIKAVEDQRITVLERVKRFEQQLDLLRGSETFQHNYHQKKRIYEQEATQPMNKRDLSSDTGSSSIYHA